VTQLPAGWSTRRPTLDDVTEILAVVHASDIAAVGMPDFSDDDVREVLTSPNFDPELDSWLALDPTGAVVAWAYIENPGAGPRDFVECYADPERGGPAQRPLLDLMLARVAARAAAAGRPELTARAGAIVSQREWTAALTETGFAFVKRYARMRVSLAGVPAEPPSPPPGVVIRPLRDEADLRLAHGIIEEAFVDSRDHQPIDYAGWRQRIPTITWDEWFVAEIDGVPGGALQSAEPAEGTDEAWIKMLAVLRPYRRRGVGEALLRHALAAYARKGRTHAGLGVDLTNPTEPVRLYRSVGLTPAYEADMYERPVAAAG
jgi:ribosomal protein S18 acetylase RimI-like enzyme